MPRKAPTSPYGLPLPLLRVSRRQSVRPSFPIHQLTPWVRGREPSLRRALAPGPPLQCGGGEAPGPGRWGRGAQRPGAAPSGPRPYVPCPILTLARRAVSRHCAPHPLAGGLAASLPERGALGGPALPSLPCAAPRPRPARASLLPPLPGTGSLSAPAAAAAALPDPTLLLAELARRRGAWAGRGESGVRGRDREGWVACSPALLPFCTPCSRQRAAASAATRGFVH